MEWHDLEFTFNFLKKNIFFLRRNNRISKVFLILKTFGYIIIIVVVVVFQICFKIFGNRCGILSLIYLWQIFNQNTAENL